MPIRSVRGLLCVVLLVLCLLTLGLLATSSGPRVVDVETAAYAARRLFGWRVACVAFGLGVATLLVLITLEALAGQRAAWAVGLVALAGIAPLGYAKWERAVWDRHPLGTAHLVGRAPTGGDRTGTTWRGAFGGECGYVSLFEVTFVSRTEARGRIIPFYAGAPLITPLVRLGQIRGTDGLPVRAELQAGKLRIAPPPGPFLRPDASRELDIE